MFQPTNREEIWSRLREGEAQIKSGQYRRYHRHDCSLTEPVVPYGHELAPLMFDTSSAIALNVWIFKMSLPSLYIAMLRYGCWTDTLPA